jgi:photosynthetic reaction center cytochrome c subunit
MRINKPHSRFYANLIVAATCMTAVSAMFAFATLSRSGTAQAANQQPVTAQRGAPESENGDAAAIQQSNAQQVAGLLKQIAGKEDQPAGDVFRNVKIFKAVPAARLLKVMQLGYATSLGVKCTYCHIIDDWSSDAVAEKQIARDMNAMAQTINNTLLKNINNLKGPNPIVNCTTCHRGEQKPALNMPDKSNK